MSEVGSDRLIADSPEMMCENGFAAGNGLGLTLGTTAGGRLLGE